MSFVFCPSKMSMSSLWERKDVIGLQDEKTNLPDPMISETTHAAPFWNASRDTKLINMEYRVYIT